ncbi:MAG: HigA family addiction module antitoxin [Rhodomicrobium sp.]
MRYTAIDNLPPVHPGEILKDELEALNMSARKFAEHIHVPPNAVTAILNGGRGVSAQMALRLGQAFGTGPGYWMRLQNIYEEKRARSELAGSWSRLPGCCSAPQLAGQENALGTPRGHRRQSLFLPLLASFSTQD